MRISTLLAITLSPIASEGLRAQPDEILVLTRVSAPGGSMSSILAVEPATGAMTARPGFSNDVLPPRALAYDPIDGRAVVALDFGGGTTRIVRVSVEAGAPAFERVLLDLPHVVTDLEVGLDASLTILTGGPSGGIWTTERDGSGLQQVFALPHARAFSSSPLSSFGVALAAPPSGAGQPSIVGITVQSSPQTPFTPPPFVMPPGRVPTGVMDLPTAVFRQALCDDAGGLYILSGGGVPSTLPSIPPLIAGATQQLRPASALNAFILGDQRDPFLRRFTTFGAGAGTITTIAGPIAGDPVDFVVLPVLSASALRFGRGCGANPPLISVNGATQVGSTLQVALDFAPANTPAVALFGVDEQRAFGRTLPLALPLGGCELLVQPLVSVPAQTDAAGSANFQITATSSPSLIGTRYFTQWVFAPGLQTTQAMALRFVP